MNPLPTDEAATVPALAAWELSHLGKKSCLTAGTVVEALPIGDATGEATTDTEDTGDSKATLPREADSQYIGDSLTAATVPKEVNAAIASGATLPLGAAGAVPSVEALTEYIGDALAAVAVPKVESDVAPLAEASRGATVVRVPSPPCVSTEGQTITCQLEDENKVRTEFTKDGIVQSQN